MVKRRTDKRIQIDSLPELAEFATCLTDSHFIDHLATFSILDLQRLSAAMPDIERQQAIILIAYILKTDLHIDEILLANNAVSKEILQALAYIKECESSQEI
jgi:hypothetical protein